MRLRGATTELEEAGLETDGMADSTSKLREEVMALTGGFDIMADAAGNTFKSTYDILKGVSERWDDMTDVSQASLLELLAGKRNGNALSAIIKNFDMAEDALQTAQNAAGSASRENEVYLQSIQGKLDQFRATWESFSTNILSSDLVKTSIEGLTKFLDILDKIVSSAGSLPAILGAAVLTATRLGKMQIFTPNNLTANPLTTVGNGAKGYAGSIKNKTKSFFTSQTANTGILDTSQIALVEKYNAAFDKNGKITAEAKEISKGFNSELKNTQAYASGTRIVLEDASNGAGKFAKGMQTASKASRLAAGAMNVLSSVAVAAAVSLAIWTISKGVEAFKDFTDHTEEAEAAINSYNEAMSKSESNLSTIKEASNEFGKLAQGVDNQGRNVSLSNAEFERYHELVQSVVSIYPELIQGYDAEGNAIVDRNNLIQDAIDLQKQYDKVAQNNYLASGNDISKSIKEQLVDQNGDRKKLTKALYDDGLSNILYDNNILQSGINGQRKDVLTDTDLESIVEARGQIVGLYRETLYATGASDSEIAAGMSRVNIALDQAQSVLQDHQAIVQDGVDWLQLKMSLDPDNPLLRLPEEFQRYTNEFLSQVYKEGSLGGLSSDEIYANAKQRIGELESLSAKAFPESKGDANSLNDYIKQINKLKDSVNDADTTSESYNKQALALRDSMHEQADAIESTDTELANLINTMADTIDLNYADVVQSIAEAFDPMAESIGRARDAKTEFDEAMKTTGDYSDGINAYKEILDEIYGEEKYHAEGRGDRTFWQAADQVLGQDRLEELDWNVDKVYEAMKVYSKAFETPNKSAELFYQKLVANKKEIDAIAGSSVKLGKNGELISFELNNDKWSQLADILNVSEETLTAMVENARQFGNISWFDGKELKKSVEASDLSYAGRSGNLYMDKQTMFQQSGAASMKEFNDQLGKIKEAGITLIDLKDNVNQTAKAFVDIGRQSGASMGNLKSNLNAEGVVSVMQRLGYSTEEVTNWLKKAGKEGIKFNKSLEQDDVKSLFETNQQNIDLFENIGVGSTDEVVSAINSMTGSINNLVAVLGGLPDALNLSQNQIDSIANKTSGYVKEGTNYKDLDDKQKASYDSAFKELSKTKELLDTLRDNYSDKEIEAKFNIDISSVESAYEEASNYIGDKQILATLGVRNDATAEAAKVKASIKTSFDNPILQSIHVDGAEAKTSATSIREFIANKFKNPITQWIQTRQRSGGRGDTNSNSSSKGGLFGGLFGSDASGTHNAKHGLSLTGELGPELVWNRKNNQSYLVGQNGPEMTNLDKGDVVYTADETKRILKGRKHEIFGSHADGYAGSISEKYVTHKDSKKKKSSKSDKSSKKENKEVTNRLDELIKRLETIKGYTAKNQKAFWAALKDAKAKGKIDNSEYDKYKKQYGNIKAGKIVDLFNADKKTYKKAADRLKKYAKAGKIEWSDYYGYIDKLNEHRIEKNEEAYKEEDKSYKKAVAYAKKRYKKGQISAEQYYSTLESINDEHYSRIIANNTKKVEHGLKTQKAAISALKKLNKQGKISTKELNEALEDLQEAAKDYAQSIIDDAERIIDRWETFSLREYTINTNGVKIDTSGFKELYREMTNLQKWGLSKYANDALSGSLKTQFGNIDTNNREVIEWTKKNIKKYSKAAKSWGEELYEGSYSTIDGRSESFNYKTTKTDKNGKKTTAWKHAEIAFSPLLQTGTGEPEFLNADTVRKYIEKIVQQAANKDGGKLKASTVFELDKKGLTIEGKKISNLIASVGKNAIDEGSLMHFAGDNGGIADSYRNIEAAAKEAGVSVKALTEYWNNSNPAKQIDYEAYKKWKEAIGEVVDETKDFSRRIRTAVDVWNDALKRLKKEAGRGQIDGVAYAEKVQEIYANIAKAQRELILDQKDQMRDLIDSVADMLKQQNDDQIDALNKEKDAWSDIIALKRKSLELTKEETQHQDQLADYTKQLADLQKQAQTLSLDDSREGKAKYADVQNQIAEVQQEMLRYQRDYSLDQAGNMLDDLDDAYGKYIEDQTEKLSKVFETQGDLIERAIAYIGSKDLPTLEKELIAWNHDNGTGYEADIKDKFDNLNGVLFDYIQNDNKISKADILAILEKALSANMGVSNSYVDAQGKTQYFDINDGSDIDDSKSAGNQISQLIAQMKENDSAIKTLRGAGISTKDGRLQALYSANAKIVEEIESIAAASTSASLKSTYTNGAISKDSNGYYMVNNGATKLVESKSANSGNTADYLINKAKNLGKVTTRYKDPEKKTGVSTGYTKLNEIAAELATIGGYSGVGVYLDSKAGAYKLKNNGKFLWHTGLAKGFVGGKNSAVPVDQNEVYRLLTKDELVLNKNDQLRLGAQLEMLGKFMETFDTSKTATKDAGKVLNNTANIELSINSPVTITGNADSTTVAQLEAFSQKTAKLALGELEGALNRSGFKVSAASNAFKK